MSIDVSPSNERITSARHEEEIGILKAKFLKHQNILNSNYEQAENEVKRLDEIYHDTVQMVLKVAILFELR